MNKIIKEDVRSIIDNFDHWEVFRNKTILISGANGFLPAYLVETFLSLDPALHVKVVALVRNRRKAETRFEHWLQNPMLEILEQDVCQDISYAAPVHFIIHAASQASPKYYGTDPVGTLNANVTGTINLMKLAHLKQVESLLYFSSGEVYGTVDEKNIPIPEDGYGYLDPTQVRSCYAESKRMGENICVSWHHQFGVKAKIVRPFHTYGPGMALDDGRVFADFVSNILQGKDITLNSDGSARRAFCYLTDATLGFLTVLIKGENGQAYNVGNPTQEYSIWELAEVMTTIKPEKNLKVYINEAYVQGNNYLKSPYPRNSPAIDKIRKLGWEPKTSVKIGFTRTVESFLA
ncbi:MAG: NAD-dependent epimerase/dehydratase family protein [Bacteroidetes bacterium]|nr:NAD-dependent epimerase/dehydratase family protein [Bacteroidota bacterium]